MSVITDLYEIYHLWINSINHREEVITVSIYEYDEEGHLEVVKEEAVNAIKNNS